MAFDVAVSSTSKSSLGSVTRVTLQACRVSHSREKGFQVKAKRGSCNFSMGALYSWYRPVAVERGQLATEIFVGKFVEKAFTSCHTQIARKQIINLL